MLVDIHTLHLEIMMPIDYDNAGEWILINMGERGMSWLDDIPEWQIDAIFRAGFKAGQVNHDKDYSG